jgi:short-subunit dehydrogenase
MKHILITGTSSGIGFALAEQLAARGYLVWAAARQLSSLQTLTNRFPSQIKPVQLDVTNSQQISSVVAEIQNTPGIDEFILINNAGVATGGPFECTPMQEIRSLFDVNVFGLVELTQKLLPFIRKLGPRARVINIGSISGLISTPYMGTYAASKFAVRALTDALRREMLNFKVEVVLIEPGPIDTKIWGKSLNRADEMRSKMNDEQKKNYTAQLDSLIKGVEATAKAAVPPQWVVDKVLHAIETRKPRPYYRVGRHVPLVMLITRFIPTRLLDRMLNGTFRFAIGE